MKLFSILESNVQEALELGIAKNYAEYIRRPETEKVVDNLMANLKQQGTFTGKESKRGERIYFNYESPAQETDNFVSQVMVDLQQTLEINQDLFKEFFGKTYSIENGKDYLDGLATDSRGQKVGIGKLFNMTIEKLKKTGKEDYLINRFEYNRRYFQEDEVRNSAINGKNKKRYIVISKANYDIAGMTTGRSWSSCMSLTSGNGQRYVHCDIKEGTLIAYLINGDDTNIQKPIARLLIKPFISTSNYKDYLYVVEDREYGTAPGFTNTVKKMFKEAQPGKGGTYRLNRKLYQDSTPGEVKVNQTVKVFDRKLFDKYTESRGGDDRLTVITGRYVSEELGVEPNGIEVISGFEPTEGVSIEGDAGYSNNEEYLLNNVREVSKIKTEEVVYLEQLPSLSTISDITAKYIFIENSPRIKSITNIKISRTIDFKNGIPATLEVISGNMDYLNLNTLDQKTADKIDIKDLELDMYLHINEFTGKSLTKLLGDLKVGSFVTIESCENLEELPENIGKDKYGSTRLRLPKSLEGKFKRPIDSNYLISYLDI